jgi:hypothetical protein
MYVPISLLFAFNLIKGPGYYNPEGEMLKPIGWGMLVFLLALLVTVFLLNIKKIKWRIFNDISSKWLLLFLIVGLLIGGLCQRNGIMLLIRSILPFN